MLIRSLAALFLLSSSVVAQAETLSLCVYDPSGANGDAFQLMKEYRIAAQGWGVDFKLKPYTDEKTASEDFKAGQCDGVVLTGTRVRSFQKFTGTIEAMGAVPSYDHLRSVVGYLASPKLAKYQKSGDYETAAVFTGGAVYLFLNDRKVNTVEQLAGKRLAVLEYDTASKVMASQVGASVVGAEIGTFAGMFNNKNVAICYAPALAYEALELYKGMGGSGGVIKYPLAQVTFQVLIRSSKFPVTFAAESRKWATQNFDRFKGMAVQAEKKIPGPKWVDIPANDRARYDEMFLETRVRLRDQEKIYDKTMLNIMKRVRCKKDGARAECALKRE